MRLYHSPGSRSARVLWALEEVGAPYGLTFMGPDRRQDPEHLLRHPLGRVPVLEFDDGTRMFESAAICLQLGDLYPGSGLLPATTSTARAAVYQWTLFAMAELEPAVIAWSRARREEGDEAEVSERFIQTATALDSALGSNQWLLGDEFSIADIISARVAQIAFNRELVEDLGVLRSYIERAHARPAQLRAAAIGAAPASPVS